jgi:hypothetical protein
MMGWQKMNDGRDWDWPVLYDSDDFRTEERFDWAKVLTFLVLAGALIGFWAVLVLAVFHLVTG